MLRALASHQCVPGSIPRPAVICGLSLLLVLVLALRVFLRVLCFFPPSQKSTFLNSNSIGNSRATGLSVVDCYVTSIIIISSIIIIIIIIIIVIIIIIMFFFLFFYFQTMFQSFQKILVT